ncbi:NAD-dependent epimerase/dehydratase family protein [Marimonas arenosa]|uniref:NAD(P)-dependent oxidoreductase n=1 Tax=Marimonas arenosa TaxID=1795305 RepID=A0AAE3WFY0_9RHOB|nr:NAD(P)-dependent oxidoreductase [Marimonas arenosa]MDQ2090955.1 NAD(P)-dependent oxidoreductase [Marimonas arenosa]
MRQQSGDAKIMPEMQQERHILVLGASGKLGRMLRNLWRDAPPPGLSIHWQYRKNPQGDGLVWQPGAPAPSDLPEIDAVVALWGVTPGPGRDLAENSRLAVAAMALAKALGAGRVLHCSSAAVYEPGPEPRAEPEAGGAVNAYGAAKLAMEAAIAEATASGGPPSCAMRIANVVGADSLFAAIDRGAGRITLDRFDGGAGPRRSYLSVPTLARALQALVTCPIDALPDVVNLADPEPYEMEELARAAGCAVDWRPAPPSAAAMVELDTGRLQRLTGVLPRTSATDIIADWRRLREPR